MSSAELVEYFGAKWFNARPHAGLNPGLAPLSRGEGETVSVPWQKTDVLVQGFHAQNSGSRYSRRKHGVVCKSCKRLTHGFSDLLVIWFASGRSADCQPNVGLALRRVTVHENYEMKSKRQSAADSKAIMRMIFVSICAGFANHVAAPGDGRAPGIKITGEHEDEGEGTRKWKLYRFKKFCSRMFTPWWRPSAAIKSPHSRRCAKAGRPQQSEDIGTRRFTAACTRSGRVARGDSFAGTALVGGALPRRRYEAGNERRFCQTNPNEITV